MPVWWCDRGHCTVAVGQTFVDSISWQACSKQITSLKSVETTGTWSNNHKADPDVSMGMNVARHVARPPSRVLVFGLCKA